MMDKIYYNSTDSFRNVLVIKMSIKKLKLFFYSNSFQENVTELLIDPFKLSKTFLDERFRNS